MTKDELKKAIGNKIVELRIKKGWSQSDLARACDKDRQAVLLIAGCYTPNHVCLNDDNDMQMRI